MNRRKVNAAKAVNAVNADINNSAMIRICSFIVDKRMLFFLLYIIAVIFSLQSIFFVREGMLYDARRAAVRSKSCSYTAIFMGLAVLALLLLLSAFGAIAFDDVILFFRDYSY